MHWASVSGFFREGSFKASSPNITVELFTVGRVQPCVNPYTKLGFRVPVPDQWRGAEGQARALCRIAVGARVWRL
jgi:hypothetical protein